MPPTRPLAVALAAAIVLAAAAASPARAHGLVLHVAPLGGELIGQATYSDGTPARGERATVVALDAPGQPARQAVTDALGQFRVPTAAPGRQRVVVEGVEGHRASVLVTVAQPRAAVPARVAAPAEAPAPAGGADPGAALAALRDEVAARRAEVVRLNARTRAGDVMAGVGLIAAIAGLGAFWLSRRGS